MKNKFINHDNFLIHEILGMPNSGKSTTIKILSKKLKKFSFAVEILDEGTRHCPFDKGKNQFLYACWGLADIAKALTKSYSFRKLNTIVLIDRGLLDRLAFTKAQIDFGYLNKNQGRAIMRLSEEICAYINSTSLHLCTAKKAMEREGAQGRKDEGRIMNLPFLEILYQEYINFNQNFKNINSIIVDSEKNSLEEGADLLLNHVLSLLKSRDINQRF